MYKNAVKKRGTAVNFELKIRIVPLKAGQLESMISLTQEQPNNLQLWFSSFLSTLGKFMHFVNDLLNYE